MAFAFADCELDRERFQLRRRGRVVKLERKVFDVLAYLPPTAPFAMPVLVGLGAVAWWQFTASVAISVICTVGLARLAAADVLGAGGRRYSRRVRRQAGGCLATARSEWLVAGVVQWQNISFPS